ncbi:Nn.00g083530.m01.CDS01 [Neocucurbitaria sp. VM-36]
MAPTVNVSSNTRWESGTTIELVALTLAVPGAIAALATLWIVLARRRQIHRGLRINPTQANEPGTSHALATGTRTSDTDAGSLDWFQEHYNDLHVQVTAERQQWADEREVS